MNDRLVNTTGQCIERARELSRGDRAVLVVAGAEDPVTMRSVWESCRLGLVSPLLVGEPEGVAGAADEVDADLGMMEVVESGPQTGEKVSRALDLLGVDGPGELVMKGAVKTGDLLGAYLDKSRGLRTGRRLSHVGVFDAPGDEDRLMMITDGGLNLNPDLETKVDIVRNAVELSWMLGIENPRVAALAHVEKAAGSELPIIRHAGELVRLNRSGKISGCRIDGPLAFDNAVSPLAARRKGIAGPVAGNADILLANEIGMGNVIYKMVQTWCRSTIAGLVLGGRVPVINPSRADTEKSKLCAIALGVILARARMEAP